MPADLVRQESAQFFEGELRSARLELDERLCRLAAVRVLHADDAHLRDAGMLVDRLLDGARVYVEPARDDHVLLAVDEIEVAVLVHGADVAGEKIAVDKRSGCLFRRVPVALGDIGTLDANLALLARL